MSGGCLFGWNGIRISNRKFKRKVRKHYDLLPSERLAITSQKVIAMLAGMRRNLGKLKVFCYGHILPNSDRTLGNPCLRIFLLFEKENFHEVEKRLYGCWVGFLVWQ